MKIGIDARFYSESGVGRYIRNLLDQLQKLDHKNEFYIFLLQKDFNKLNTRNHNFHKVIANFKWYGSAEQFKLLILLRRYKLDLVHFPHFNVPIFYSGKYVVTIHDLIHQHHKMRRASSLNPLVYQVKHQAYNFALKTALKKSQKVITVSGFVRNQLIEEMGAPKNKIVITNEAVDNKILEISKKISQTEIKKTLDKFNIKPPFIFYVGNAHPHKNVEGLIKAFLELRKKYQYLQLVLAGHDHYFWERLKAEVLDSRFRVNDNIIFSGFITDEELVAFYKSAKAFVMPSFEEGFGIPILEAMACGCPVVSSNAGSLPEVGGDAAAYFNPRNLQEMSEKIQEVLNDEKLKKQLIEKGEKRFEEFSWKKLAEETHDVYTNVLIR
jgi:glycosyltransferase involved in cell wall biosynthesis